MMAQNQTVTSNLEHKDKPEATCGQLMIFADSVNASEDVIKFQVSAMLKSKKILCFGNDNPYLLVERARKNNHHDFVRVLQTSYQIETTEPWWNTHQMTMTEFCNNNKFLPIRLSAYAYVNSGDHPCYGSVVTTTREIEMSSDRELILLNEKGRPSGCVVFNQLKMDMRPSLVDYLGHGWKMDVSIAIDFTLSNFEVHDHRSLHGTCHYGDMNMYEKAIFEVCNVM